MSVSQHSLSEPVFQNDAKLHESPVGGFDQTRSPCDRCGQVFDTFDDLQNHPFECISMEKLNSPLKKVKTECGGSRPAKKKYNEVDLACNAYKETFEDSKDLQSHLTDCPSMNDDAVDVHPVKRARVEKAKSYHCEQCCKAFKTEVGLNNHIKLHSDERPFVCSTCGRGFVQEICLKAHIEAVHGDKMYTCSIPGCDKTFKSVYCFKAHEKIHNKKFNCDLCDKRFVNGQSLKIHVRSHTGEKPFECNVCQKRFSKSSYLKAHQRVHSGERPFVCSTCGKSFVLKTSLKTHIDGIHGDKKYTCSIPGCNKVFSSENYAKVHLKIHNKVLDFECDFCDKRFVNKQSLKIHVRSHTGEKPFECNVCQMRFSQIPHLKTHQRVHSGERPFVCDVCGKAFRQTSNLIEHKAFCHKV